MNVETITMDPDVAGEQLFWLEERLKRRADEEYEALKAAYEALHGEQPVLALDKAILDAGFGEDNRPRLAVARADRRQVRTCRRRTRLSFHFGTSLDFDWRWPQMSRNIDNAPDWPHRRVGGEYAGSCYGYALVPLIPPEHDPGTVKRSEYMILWEVEEWADKPILAVPDRDPMLLRPLGHGLFAVEASWDLTPLERLVMAGRGHE